MIGAKPYQPTAGTPTAGELRRATARAFDRWLEQDTARDHAQFLASNGQAVHTEPVKVDDAAELVEDELGRRPKRNRVERRARMHSRRLTSKQAAKRDEKLRHAARVQARAELAAKLAATVEQLRAA